jgi:hypothetical protein
MWRSDTRQSIGQLTEKVLASRAWRHREVFGGREALRGHGATHAPASPHPPSLDPLSRHQKGAAPKPKPPLREARLNRPHQKKEIIR